MQIMKELNYQILFISNSGIGQIRQRAEILS
jgi:hypothetical protein